MASKLIVEITVTSVIEGDPLDSQVHRDLVEAVDALEEAAIMYGRQQGKIVIKPRTVSGEVREG